MADYDVAAIGLASPPASAYKTTYRPAITVRNNGIHPARVTGSISILNLDTGLQVFSSPVLLANLAAGQEGQAEATSEVTFDTEGKYIAFGYVTTEHDAYSPNNNLNPTNFKVGPGTPPPPVVVPAHATQHENGGSDELEVSGLAGKLNDPQDPTDHAAEHQLGGGDQISVDGLIGTLSSPQTPKSHGNEKHSPTMATSAELSAHQGASAVHAAALNLANRETTGPDAGLLPILQLGKGTHIQVAGDKYYRDDRYFDTPVPDGICVLWDSTNPTPEGWAPIVILPGPQPPMIYIEKLPSTP